MLAGVLGGQLGVQKANLRADGHEFRPNQPPFAATSEPAHRTLQVGGYLLEVLVRAVPHSLFDLPEAFLQLLLILLA